VEVCRIWSVTAITLARRGGDNAARRLGSTASRERANLK
jgi:hypothetical protein